MHPSHLLRKERFVRPIRRPLGDPHIQERPPGGVTVCPALKNSRDAARYPPMEELLNLAPQIKGIEIVIGGMRRQILAATAEPSDGFDAKVGEGLARGGILV